MKTTEELKSEFINKACEWLKKNAANCVKMKYNEFHHDCDYEGYDTEKLLKEFREAMQEKKNVVYEAIYREFGKTYKSRKIFSSMKAAEKYLVGCNDIEINEIEID